MPDISILLADAQGLVRRGLRSIIADTTGFEVVAEAADTRGLASLLEQYAPDMVIMDHHSEGLGLEAIDLVKRSAPEAPILIISSEDNKRAINEVLERGVQSFLTKSCGEEEIADAVRATARGEKFFCTRVIDFLLEKSFPVPGEADCRPTPLTAREVEVVQLTAQGLVAKEIAARLNLSTHTVYTHRKNIMKKLQLNSASELVLYAIQQGLVEQ